MTVMGTTETLRPRRRRRSGLRPLSKPHCLLPLGRLLHLANASPPFEFRKEFYALKEEILERYGTRDGHDVQHIPGKECYTCDGTGIFERYNGDTDYCYRCGGSGWYKSPVWVVLERFRLGRFSFHIPRKRSYTKPDPDTTRIHGYIKHASYGQCGVFAETVAGHKMSLRQTGVSLAGGFQTGIAGRQNRWLGIERQPQLVLRSFETEPRKRKPQHFIRLLKNSLR